MDKIKILYISTLVSERFISEIIKKQSGIPHFAAQKYNRLLARGIVLNENLFDLKTICIPEYSFKKKPFRFFWNQSEQEKGLYYDYISILTVPVLKHIVILFGLVVRIVRWRLVNKEYKKVIIIDILNLFPSLISILIARLTGIKIVAIVTDLPLMLKAISARVSLKEEIFFKLLNLLVKTPDGFIFLTEPMNTVLNSKHKPYCIIEGLAETKTENVEERRLYGPARIIHYSGGLYQKFGIKTFIEAFENIDDPNISLHIFGRGDLEGYIAQKSGVDKRIVFFGYKDNTEVIEDQLRSFLLVNPRFSDEEYTKYSFPSKTIEYMSSGTPLLTTKLEGIPAEYFKYVYCFDKETVEGFRESLIDVLNKPRAEVLNFGQSAKEFVVRCKNNKIQAEKLYYCINQMF